MSEWKTGEPPEDGWYWLLDPNFLGKRITRIAEKEGDDWWFVGVELWFSWSDNWRWQGPLTPPEGLPPSPPE